MQLFTIIQLGNNYIGSYTSVTGSSGLENSLVGVGDGYTDMYAYIRNQASTTLKEAYYTALARERWGSYHVNNDVNLKYFLNSY